MSRGAVQCGERRIGRGSAPPRAGGPDARGPSSPTLRDGDLTERLFESLVALSIRTYAQAAEARVYHLRTRNGDQEIDLIVQRDDGRTVAIEVKIAPTVTDDDVRHLHWLREYIGPDLLDAVVVTAGPTAAETASPSYRPRCWVPEHPQRPTYRPPARRTPPRTR
jgi:hypothetical protein